MTKIGAGTLTLNAANSYTGGTVFDGGAVAITADSQLGTAPSIAAKNLTFNGGTLQFGKL